MYCEEVKSYNEYYMNDRYMCILCEAKYTENNRENISKRANKRDKERRKTDPIYKCRKNVSGMIYIGLKKCNSYKNKSSWENLPYTPSILKQYIESQFRARKS